MGLVPIQGSMLADSHTAAVFSAVNRRLGGGLRITAPYGAHRSRAQQQHLRNLYLQGKGAFAALPGTSNHEGRGTALDISNWASYPNLRAVMAEYGMVRDPREPWHYNDTLTWVVPAPPKPTPPPIRKATKMDILYVRTNNGSGSIGAVWKVGTETVFHPIVLAEWIRLAAAGAYYVEVSAAYFTELTTLRNV